MATHNGQKYIRRQLDSLAAQSYLPAELVITDDDSKDNTLAIIDTFAKIAPFPVNVYRNETRLGYRKNFMRVASLCRSDLIAFCDQDDYWYKDKISALIKPFSNPDILLAYHNADVIDDDGNRIGSLAARASRQFITRPLSSGPWLYALGFTEVFRRSLLQLSDLWVGSLDHIFADEPMAHDQWFFFLASVFGDIAYLDKPLVAYMQHRENAYGWTRRSLKEFFIKHFSNHSQRFYRAAKAAERRANILQIAMDKFDGSWRERAVVAAEYYRKVAFYCAGRGTLYTSRKFGDRFGAFSAILKKGGYAGGAWTLGRRSLVPDLCLGVTIGHLLPFSAR
jgi:glycosyltransferase involved in cell wall biosynthesis